jgi:hypothetical protein
MFLQIMPLPGDISDGRLPRRELDTCDLSHGRVGFLGLGGIYFGTDGFLLVTLFQERGFGLFWEMFTCASSD